MIDSFTDEVEQADCQRAAQIMAELALFTLQDNCTTDKKRVEIVSSYVLACAFAYEFEELEDSLTEGLVHAGAEKDMASQFAHTMTSLTNMRYIFSLSFVHEDQKSFGLRKGVKKKWLDPKQFFNSILELG